MSQLAKYILDNCLRGDCTCGRCDDVPAKKFQPDGHTVDVQFFKVALKNNPSDDEKEIIKDQLIELIKTHDGEFCDIDLFDGNEHSYTEIGGWIGDRGLALMLMGMGNILDMWKLMTPNSVAGGFSEETRKMLAETGYITIISNNR